MADVSLGKLHLSVEWIPEMGFRSIALVVSFPNPDFPWWTVSLELIWWDLKLSWGIPPDWTPPVYGPERDAPRPGPSSL